MEPVEFELVPVEEAEQQILDIQSAEEIPEASDTIMGPQDADMGIIFHHGFAGSNVELLYIGNSLAQHGYRVLIPLLPGHGTHSDDMLDVTAEQWLAKAEEAYKFITNEKKGRRIYYIGHSMGGAISLLMAAKHQVTGVVAIAAPIRFPLFHRMVVKLVSRLKFKFFYEEFFFHDESLYDHPGIAHFIDNYGRIPLKVLHQLFRLLDWSYQSLPDMTAPLCLINALTDHVVPGSQAEIIRDQVKSGDIEVHWLVNSDHIVVIDSDRNLVIEKILNFLKRIS